MGEWSGQVRERECEEKVGHLREEEWDEMQRGRVYEDLGRGEKE